MTVLTASEAEGAAQAVLRRAAADREFHALALRDSGAAIRDVTGKDVPAGYTVRFVDNCGADRTIVLPEPVQDSEELSDAQLEHVAGGRCGQSCGGSCAWSDSIPTPGGGKPNG